MSILEECASFQISQNLVIFVVIDHRWFTDPLPADYCMLLLVVFQNQASDIKLSKKAQQPELEVVNHALEKWGYLASF